MKNLYVILCLVFAVYVSSCSKKGDAAPTPHTITVTVNGSAGFTATLNVLKTTQTMATTLDKKTVDGAYTFTTTLNSGDEVHLEIQTSSENLMSYKITDNAATGIEATNREVGSFTKFSVDYTVQ